MMRIPAKFQALTCASSESERIEASACFLAEIWDYPAQTITVIGVKTGDRWKDIYISGNRKSRVIEIMRQYPPSRHDLYYCPNGFSEPSRKTEFGLPTRFAVCDVDENDLSRYDPPPNIVWETSPGRHQAMWIWQKFYPAVLAEQYSRAIVYRNGGDKGGWSHTKMLRAPGTVNHKPAYAKPIVTLKTYDPQLQKLPDSLKSFVRAVRSERRVSSVVRVDGIDRREVMQRYRDQMGLQARTLMEASRVIYPDRSKAIFIMVSDLITAGVSDAEIVVMLMGNPHFVEKHGENLAMAEREVVTIRAKVEAGQ